MMRDELKNSYDRNSTSKWISPIRLKQAGLKYESCYTNGNGGYRVIAFAKHCCGGCLDHASSIYRLRLRRQGVVGHLWRFTGSMISFISFSTITLSISQYFSARDISYHRRYIFARAYEDHSYQLIFIPVARSWRL